MYDELVKRLRERSVFLFPHHGESRSYDADLMHEAADAIEELTDNHVGKWIPVTERLPYDRRDVQITVFWHDAWRTMYGYYDGAFWHLYAPMHTEVADVEVIGWMEKPDPMPLPEPPKEGEHTMEEFMYGQEGNPNDGSM